VPIDGSQNSDPRVHHEVAAFGGADKGGVGKTTIARTLVDYYQSHGISLRAFDTEYPGRHPTALPPGQDGTERRERRR
jgi:hypothetical protein